VAKFCGIITTIFIPLKMKWSFSSKCQGHSSQNVKVSKLKPKQYIQLFFLDKMSWSFSTNIKVILPKMSRSLYSNWSSMYKSFSWTFYTWNNLNWQKGGLETIWCYVVLHIYVNLIYFNILILRPSGRIIVPYILTIIPSLNKLYQNILVYYVFIIGVFYLQRICLKPARSNSLVWRSDKTLLEHLRW
jgi:hypothetical protein